jgi:uncharacterized membrane protein
LTPSRPGSCTATGDEEWFVNEMVDTAKERVQELIEKLTEKVAEKLPEATGDSALQAVTIGRPKNEVIDAFSDPARLSVVLGDVARVESIGSDRLRWTFTATGEEDRDWDCVVSLHGDRLRFTDARPDSAAGLTLDFRDAPQDRGTEVIARVSAPTPGMLTGLLAFKALYRARALLQTGEVPTLRHNPSARPAAR